MMETHCTIAQESIVELEIKRSRFIGWIRPVDEPAQAENLIAEARGRWPGANHYCYAWIVRSPAAERCGDDGEPSGTAGYPMLTVLKHHHLIDTAVVVIRYFGGTLLGSSGLIRAYSDTVRAAVDQAGLIQYHQGCKVSIMIDYPDSGTVQHALQRRPGSIVAGIDYSDRVRIEALIPRCDCAELQLEIQNLTRARAVFEVHEDTLLPVHRAGISKADGKSSLR